MRARPIVSGNRRLALAAALAIYEVAASLAAAQVERRRSKGSCASA